ncbi:HAD family hydrolase [Paenibacillus radicis (ex Xue et al. 2023)]|uniref:HAD family hydrolase n=1 Tax=Paenibacillus radicis (ex Xue et al. 2023) TaxID=2972489 RepID=A0ABT1YCK7_9BACL|nr:HAD family hydrolase [Paenibacillus radicis (ex Xue et al. 2023)]MCR8630940.1 HAD family hydrolase [Paenibacillus radicis (ex Xue et al. 2023)]
MSIQHRTHDKKAICFDVNQTLIYQGVHFEQAFLTVWNEYSARWSRDDETPRAVGLWEAYQANWQQQKKLRGVKLQLDELQQKCLMDALKELEIPVHQHFPIDFFRMVRNHRLAAKSLAPGVVDTLRELSPNFKLAIISNSPRSEVIHLLDRFGLHPFFPNERIFTAVKHADKKPGTPLFKTAVRTLDLSPRQAVMVGNSWKHDVCGAVKSGMDAVWIQRHTDGSAKKISQQKLGKRNVFCIQQMDQLLELFS